MVEYNSRLFPPVRSVPSSRTDVLLNDVTATGAGSAVSLGIPYSRFTGTIKWGGTMPTSTIVALEGSIDNSLWDALATVTSSATTTMFHVVNKPVAYIRGNWNSKAGGAANTSVKVSCMSSGA